MQFLLNVRVCLEKPSHLSVVAVQIAHQLDIPPDPQGLGDKFSKVHQVSNGSSNNECCTVPHVYVHSPKTVLLKRDSICSCHRKYDIVWPWIPTAERGHFCSNA